MAHRIAFFALAGYFAVATLQLLSVGEASAQCPYFTQLLIEGDTKFKSKDFRGAINKYQAAITDCPERAGEVQGRVLRVFDRIDELREEAELQRGIANAALEEINIQQSRNQRLIDAFYFYEDSLALSRSKRLFGFVDHAGQAIIPYRFTDAGQFESPGFAVAELQGNLFMINTSGQIFNAAYDMNRIEGRTTAVMLDRPLLDDVRSNVLNQPQLEMLVLKNLFHFRDVNYLHPAYSFSLPWTIDKDWRLLNLELLSIENGSLDSLSPVIGEMVRMKRLCFSHNKIRILPPEIGNLSRLIYLDLSYNELAQIPQEISKLSVLTNLSLAGNPLERLPASIFMLHMLQKLNLSAIGMKSIPSEIFELTSLTELDLSINEIEVIDSRMQQFKQMKELHLGFNPCSNTVEKQEVIIKQMLEWLPNCSVNFD